MTKAEFEAIKYPTLKHVKIFVDSVYSKDDHLHNDFEVFLVLNGRGRIKINNEIHNYNKDDIFLISSGDIHSFLAPELNGHDVFLDSNSIDNAPLIAFFHISNHFLREYFPQIRNTVFKSGNLVNFFSSDILSDFRHLLLDASNYYYKNGKEFESLELILTFTKIVSELYKYVDFEIISESQKQKNKERNARLNRIISYIDDNFTTQVRLQDLADIENLSVTHFSHLFSYSFGETFQEYINLKRAKKCVELITKNDNSLLDISSKSGFSDPKYMNKMFLKMYGCTPKEYRKELMKHDNINNESSVLFERNHNAEKSFELLKKYKAESSKIE